jgi:hypothetical protein
MARRATLTATWRRIGISGGFMRRTISGSSRTAIVLLFVAAMAAASATSSAASPITFAFTGTVTQIEPGDPDPFLGTIGFGTLFSGSYTFESTATDAIGDPSSGAFVSPFTLTVDFDGPVAPFSVTGFAVVTLNAFVDQYGVYGNDGIVEIQFLLESSTDPLTDDTLPLTPPLLASFSQRVFTFRDAAGIPEILGTIDSLACTDGCTSVPEPATIIVLALGLGATQISRRKT